MSDSDTFSDTSESCVFDDSIFDSDYESTAMPPFVAINNDDLPIATFLPPTVPKTETISHHSFFTTEFVCYSFYFSASHSQRQMLRYEQGDRIILPSSALYRFSVFSKDQLYVLRLFNPMRPGKLVFAGVADFSAPDRVMYAPEWIKHTLSLKNGDRICADALNVPKITYAKIKICDDIPDHPDLNIKAVIEQALQNHCILYLTKQIYVKIFEKIFTFEFVELQPENIGSIIDVDVRIDLVR